MQAEGDLRISGLNNLLGFAFGSRLGSRLVPPREQSRPVPSLHAEQIREQICHGNLQVATSANRVRVNG